MGPVKGFESQKHSSQADEQTGLAGRMMRFLEALDDDMTRCKDAALLRNRAWMSSRTCGG